MTAMTKFYGEGIYVKMCGKALELQAEHQITKFDIFQDSNSGDLFLYDDNMMRKYIGTWIWLPQQDQLQNMIELEEGQKQKLGISLGKWDDYDIQIVYRHFCSDQPFVWLNDCNLAEAALLRIIMWQRFHKTWSGEDWV